MRVPMILLTLGIAALSVTASGQATPCQAKGQAGRALLIEALRYGGIEPPPDAIRDRIAAAWCRAQESTITLDERQAAFVEMFGALNEARTGRPPNPVSLQGLARFAATMAQGGARMDLTLPTPRAETMKATLHVDRRGRGRDTLMLIAGLGSDAAPSYASFITRHESKYRLVLVTLPGIGKAPALPWPAQYDVSARPWLTAIERALSELIDKEPRPVVVIGPSSAGYFAALLALDRPAKVRAAVLLDALVASPMRSVTDPDAPVAFADRLARSRGRSPAPQFFPIGAVPDAAEVRRLLDNPVAGHPTVQNWMGFAVRDDARSRQWSFDALTTGYFPVGIRAGAELQATDLTDDMKALSVPMLAIGAHHDDGSPAQGTPTTAQWRELQLRWPSIPLQVATFNDTRSFITEDRPVELDRALDDFLGGRPVHGRPERTDAPRPSPHASVSQGIGAARVTVTFGRPAVNGRGVWGGVVPYGRVWRAGANEATEITLSNDLDIEGRRLKAGTYAFFVIPSETTWTMVFNRVTPQWGAFNYTKEFDALRVDVPARDAAHVERLAYTIDPEKDGTAWLTLHWGTREASVRLSQPARTATQ